MAICPTVSGFSILKNGEKFGFPWRESLRSLAPLVDEIVVAHGDSDDGTGVALKALAKELPCPLVILDSPWDAASQKGGLELSRQTNIALEACRGDVVVYLQGDEVFHEADSTSVREDLARLRDDPDVDALAFGWLHFYGTYATVMHSRQWYRHEVRAFKKAAGLRSYGDAQGFRIPVVKPVTSAEPSPVAPSDAHSKSTSAPTPEGTSVEPALIWQKPRAAMARGEVYHYGWVRPADLMAQKSESFDRLWHGAARDGTHEPSGAFPPLFGMKIFKGIHPTVMRDRIAAFEKQFKNYDPFAGRSPVKNGKYWKLFTTDLIEEATGWRPGEFRSFRLVKRY